jgi:hypothetical protein
MAKNGNTCEKCGHVTPKAVVKTAVKVSELTKEDVGLWVNGRHGNNGFLISYGTGESGGRPAWLVSLDYNLSGYDRLHEPGSGTLYYYDPDDTVTVHRVA